jgi:hypothetical protein
MTQAERDKARRKDRVKRGAVPGVRMVDRVLGSGEGGFFKPVRAFEEFQGNDREVYRMPTLDEQERLCR